jgi:hypothetical protein
MKYLILILLLAACQPDDWDCAGDNRWSQNQEKRTQIFLQCLDKMQAIAPKTDHTELEEAIDSCDNAAYYQSKELKPECK